MGSSTMNHQPVFDRNSQWLHTDRLRRTLKKCRIRFGCVQRPCVFWCEITHLSRIGIAEDQQTTQNNLQPWKLLCWEIDVDGKLSQMVLAPLRPSGIGSLPMHHTDAFVPDVDGWSRSWSCRLTGTDVTQQELWLSTTLENGNDKLISLPDFTY